MNIIITGGSSGLGLASAEAFAEAGHNITLLARGEKRLLEAAEQLRMKYPDAHIEERVLDVSNLDQVREFAKEITQPVDILMNNAGLMGPDFSLSIEGIESQMATNHIGHFLLTSLLWEQLEQSASPRVISVSSVVHRKGRIRADSLEEIRGAKKGSYDRWQRYADTKLACVQSESGPAPKTQIERFPGSRNDRHPPARRRRRWSVVLLAQTNRPYSCFL
mgnify:CR=1 FL=1